MRRGDSSKKLFGGFSDRDAVARQNDRILGRSSVVCLELRNSLGIRRLLVGFHLRPVNWTGGNDRLRSILVNFVVFWDSAVAIRLIMLAKFPPMVPYARIMMASETESAIGLDKNRYFSMTAVRRIERAGLQFDNGHAILYVFASDGNAMLFEKIPNIRVVGGLGADACSGSGGLDGACLGWFVKTGNFLQQFLADDFQRIRNCDNLAVPMRTAWDAVSFTRQRSIKFTDAGRVKHRLVDLDLVVGEFLRKSF